MKISKYMINILRWYCDTYIMGLETGFLFGTIIVVQSLRPPLHGQDHISTIWQGCKILDQHSQYSHIVYHTTRKIDIQNSFPSDISLGSSNFSWMEEHPNPFDTLYPGAGPPAARIRALPSWPFEISPPVMLRINMPSPRCWLWSLRCVESDEYRFVYNIIHISIYTV